MIHPIFSNLWLPLIKSHICHTCYPNPPSTTWPISCGQAFAVWSLLLWNVLTGDSHSSESSFKSLTYFYHMAFFFFLFPIHSFTPLIAAAAAKTLELKSPKIRSIHLSATFFCFGRLCTDLEEALHPGIINILEQVLFWFHGNYGKNWKPKGLLLVENLLSSFRVQTS